MEGLMNLLAALKIDVICLICEIADFMIFLCNVDLVCSWKRREMMQPTTLSMLAICIIFCTRKKVYVERIYCQLTSCCMDLEHTVRNDGVTGSVSEDHEKDVCSCSCS